MCPLGENGFDAAVSVESLHHFTKEEKIPLYAKVRAALKEGGVLPAHRLLLPVGGGGAPPPGDFACPEEGPGPGGRSVLPLRHPPHRGPRGGSLGSGGVLPGGDRKPVGPHLRHPGGEVTPDDKKERHLPGIQAGGVFSSGEEILNRKTAAERPRSFAGPGEEAGPGRSRSPARRCPRTGRRLQRRPT